jgi:catechol 2,3-dioxygenase-like lactoylglutathione lyase family enzyme
MITGIDHIDITVGDIDTSTAFFTGLGFQVIRRTTHGGVAVELKYPGENQPIIELHPSKLPDGREQPIGVGHIAFKVTDINAIADLVEEKKFEVIRPPEFYDVTGRTLFSIADPDGGKVQFIQSSEKGL